MSDTSNEDRIDVPSGNFTFCFGPGVEFTADVTELEGKMYRLAKEAHAKELDDYDYLETIAAHIKERYNVTVTIGQVDSLRVKITEAVARKKKLLLSDLNAMQGSPTSTTSTPSDPDL